MKTLKTFIHTVSWSVNNQVEDFDRLHHYSGACAI